MANHKSRRPAFAVGILGAAAWAISSRIRSSAFSAVPATPRAARTALRGFKEDFDAWRGSLSPEEAALVQAQAEGEFNKKFRKSDEFKKDLPKDKVEAFQGILKKFFDAEAEDFKNEEDAKTPDYEGLQKKASEKKMDFSLKSKIIQMNRDADRRYNYATMRIRESQNSGSEPFPQSSPQHETWVIQNNDTQSHEYAKTTLKFIEAAMNDPSCPEKLKPAYKEAVAKGVPPMGENIELDLPMVLTNQIHHMLQKLQKDVNAFVADKSEADKKKYIDEKVPEIATKVIAHLAEKWTAATLEVENEVVTMKNFYNSQKKEQWEGKTKADVLKEIWAELPKHSDKPVPPLDEEMLAELAEEPAIIEGEFRHSWGTADVLYKSEAIDAFGMKYLLGVFDTVDEAKKAFEDWNKEYEQARVEMKAEMEQWGKQEQARLDRDTSANERIKSILEEARR